MAAEPFSASLVSRLAIPDTHHVPDGYFRSKLFISTSTTNPLVAAASPLFSLLERLCISSTLPPVKKIRDNIEHELYAFQSQLLALTYADEFIAIANYLVTATIDELIGKNYMRLFGTPAEFNAFTPATLDNIGPQQRFFDIIQHMKERANQYLDLLELAYYCLIAGFEGEQHLKPDGRHRLDNLIEELYQLIHQHRANKVHRLFHESPDALPGPTQHKSTIMTSIFTFLSIACLYMTSQFMINHHAESILTKHAQLAYLDY